MSLGTRWRVTDILFLLYLNFDLKSREELDRGFMERLTWVKGSCKEDQTSQTDERREGVKEVQVNRGTWVEDSDRKKFSTYVPTKTHVTWKRTPSKSGWY